MALLNPTFIFGIFVLLYLSSFVLFAIIRILTGLSIQRIGYFSLRRLAYVPRDGIKIEIRGLGLNVHRPTFAQPTWLSIKVSELVVTADIRELDGNKANGSRGQDEDDPLLYKKEKDSSPLANSPPPPVIRRGTSSTPRSETWKQLTKIKERIKKLHRNVNWLRMVDVFATNSTVNIVGVGNIQFGSVAVAVDTRRKMVDRARFFWGQRSRDGPEKHQAEWIMTLRSVLFTANGGEPLEVLDHLTLNVHGFLYERLDGLRDASMALKLGRVHVPYDDIMVCAQRLKQCKQDAGATAPHEADSADDYVDKVMQEIDEPGSTDDDLMQTVSDSKEFVSSILRGIKEVQFAVSFVGFTKRINAVKASAPVMLNASMKEVGIDLHRLDSKSPAHRMYFPSKDIAHEALAAALSISIGVDDGHGKSQRLMYVPMATTTIRTTLPSKTVEITDHGDAEQRNANILFANSVVTSPSIDLDPRHLPLLIAMLQPKPKSRSSHTQPQQRHLLISRLLPKANIKFSMHEPVVRIALPPVDKTSDPDDFDLIISSISSISLDVESFHSTVEDLHYSLASNLRIQTHSLYYQASAGTRFDLMQTESFDLKIDLSATPDVQVVASGNLQTFSMKMIRPEISDGLRQIVRQLRLNVEPDKRASSKTPKHPNFLRGMPSWLLHLQLQASDFSAEVAGVDEEISCDSRGVSLQLESWSAEYRAQRLNGLPRRPARRRAASRTSVSLDSDLLKNLPTAPRKKHQNAGDGRRIAFHVRGLEAFVVESADRWEAEPFINIPRFEVALSTLSDHQGPIFHIHSHVRTLQMQYSLYRHYAVGVAVSVLRKAFLHTHRDNTELKTPASPGNPRQSLGVKSFLAPPSPDYHSGDPDEAKPTEELVTVDFKATFIQIKANMPADPPLMLQIHSLEAGRHRWSPPFFHSKLIRLYAEAPRMRGVWARLVCIKNGRLDYRAARRKTATGGFQDDKMVDIVTDAVRAAVPHELIIHQISDNITNVIKATKQLHHRFQTGTNEYILDKGPEDPKIVPKISFRSKSLLFELEDGAFEWKLGMIYRAGRVEQMQRLAREEAFRVKVKKIHEEDARRETSKYRARSAMDRGRSSHSGASRNRSRSEDNRPRSSSESQPRGRTPRYDPEGACEVSGAAQVSIGEARNKLNEHNAHSWRTRIDRHCAMARNGMKDIRTTFWGTGQIPDDFEEGENILEVPERPGLMSALIHDLHFVIDKPSFPMKQLPDFLHKVGKGMPRDMKYSLLIPMNVQINMGEARVSLRDYPLPLLHVPRLKSGQSSRTPALSLKTDFVIAEEFRDKGATRHVRVNVIPPRNPGSNEGSFSIDVKRTIGPVKSFSDMSVDINTALPTRITWGPSYQPAIQDMMMVIESFTKPQLDPSERVGFWDKIRLNFHSRVRIAWKGDGDVHLCLKGTRDPYQVTGNGAGFLMCWRNDVKWNLHADDDPKRFMVVESGEYVLAIPDFSHYAREAVRQTNDDDSVVSDNSLKAGAAFKKVVMKLSGKVQWMAGLVFERAIENGKRSFDFKPHYEVMLKAPNEAKADENGVPYDAFRGFRSQHIHLSIAVSAPVDRDWASVDVEPSRSYNAVHLTPRFFTHFFAWWSLFGGPMSLPVRQGRLWPGREKSSKKFGRHLATIKYNLLLAPLFLSHIYKHKDVEDYDENAVSATGIKVRFDSWKLDLHQRREEFNTRDKGWKTQSRTTGMKIHAAQLDLAAADVRAVSASIKGTTAEAIQKNHMGPLITQQDDDTVDLSRFTIPDNDFSWIDMDDFVELDWILPTEPSPDTKILPLAFCPRVTYFRQTDIGGVIAGDPDRTSPFGHEPSHVCIMTQDDDPRRVQARLVQQRLEQLTQQRSDHNRNIGEAELRVLRDVDDNPNVQAELEILLRHSNVLNEKNDFLESMLEQLTVSSPQDTRSSKTNDTNGHAVDSETSVSGEDQERPIPTGAEFASDFKNRFVVHNMQLKWNNLLRNIILRYSHQVSQRRGFIYYLSRPAVKFILDIVEEQTKIKTTKTKDDAETTPTGRNAAPPTAAGLKRETTKDIEDRIRKILQDGRKFVNADEPGRKSGEENVPNVAMEDLCSGIADGFTPQSSYHVRLIAPQIQLQSDKNTKHVVMLTSKGMELKVVEVLDKDRISDTVSGLVQRRFLVTMDSTQFFVSHQKWFSTQLLSMYSGSNYGTPSGSAAWPPWVPMEVMFDFRTDPFGFKRVVQKTSAMLRYDKYNTLRLKYNDEVNTGEASNNESSETTETRMDNLWVEFPQARAICNSSQYYAVYVIVLDLLMYSEPLEKTRNERLEKIMLASDFSDLRGTPEMVIKLQERIRQLEDIKSHFQIHSKYLDKRGWEDRLLLERDLAACEDELFFMMKAITTSQRKYDTSQSNALLKWSISAKDIVWHLIRDANEPLCELQLKDVEYDRTDNSDGSHINLIRVGKVLGLNLLPDAIYPEMVTPYNEDSRLLPDMAGQAMIRVYWNMLEAIAGIPVMDHFEVNLFPMKIQLEREVGKKLFEYIFPDMNGDGKDQAGGNKNDSPLPGDEDGDGDEDSLIGSGRLGTATSGGEKNSQFLTRPGSLELRLRPTLTSETKATSPPKNKALSVHSVEGSGSSFRFFRSAASNNKVPAKKKSWESLRSLNPPRPGIGRAATGISTNKAETASIASDSKKSRFNLRKSEAKNQSSDDLTKMITRASNYMTFAHIKLPSVVLCLSYKGKGERNLEDVHDFVFRLPTVEYHNKTWSNLDLALAFKSRVIKALISHTGAIIGNKFSKHRPNTAQQSKLRELVTSSVLLATPQNDSSHHSHSGDDSSSIFGTSPVDYSRSPPRSLHESQSFSMPKPRSLSRSSSVTSSSPSFKSNQLSINTGVQEGGGNSSQAPVPAFLMMSSTLTPPTPKLKTESESSNKNSGFGLSMLRPTSSSSMRSFGSRRGSDNGATAPEPGLDRKRPTLLGGNNNAGGYFKEKISAFASRLNKDRGGPPATNPSAPQQRPPSRLSTKSRSMSVDEVVEEEDDEDEDSVLTDVEIDKRKQTESSVVAEDGDRNSRIKGLRVKTES